MRWFQCPAGPWLVSALVAMAWICSNAEHTEELRLRPLPHTEKLLAHFHFATEESGETKPSLYPSVLRQILIKYDVASVHLSFAVGRYTDARYGPARMNDDETPNDYVQAPFGARLQVEFDGNASAQHAMERWKGVTSELGGIFSASLNQMTETTVVAQLGGSSTTNLGRYTDSNSPSLVGQFLQASLAREELCTENLTPWLKMLPCRSHAGLGTLIDPIKVLSGEYLAVSIYAAHSQTRGSWSFHQHLTTVQDATQLRGADSSLGSVFFEGASAVQTTLSACPLAAKSLIVTESTTGPSDDHVSGGHGPTIDLMSAPSNTVSLSDPWIKKFSSISAQPTGDVVSVHRFLTGYGQVHGGIAVRLENNHPRCGMLVNYHDVTPWYLRLYFHTFKARVDVGAGAIGAETRTSDASVTNLKFEPAELRGHPNQLHVEVVLPPRSSVVMSVQFDKAFIRLSEHPPDANRGFDIAPGVATYVPEPGCSMQSDFSRVHFTEPLVVALPTPDFSMPYNVITLTSTVVAFFVGRMLNTLLRKAPRIQRMLATEKKTASG